MSWSLYAARDWEQESCTVANCPGCDWQHATPVGPRKTFLKFDWQVPIPGRLHAWIERRMFSE